MTGEVSGEKSTVKLLDFATEYGKKALEKKNKGTTYDIFIRSFDKPENAFEVNTTIGQFFARVGQFFVSLFTWSRDYNLEFQIQRFTESITQFKPEEIEQYISTHPNEKIGELFQNVHAFNGYMASQLTQVPSAVLINKGDVRIDAIMINFEGFLKTKTIEAVRSKISDAISKNGLSFNIDGSFTIGNENIKTVQDRCYRELGITDYALLSRVNTELNIPEICSKHLPLVQNNILTNLEKEINLQWDSLKALEVANGFWEKLEKTQTKFPLSFKTEFETRCKQTCQKLIQQGLSKEVLARKISFSKEGDIQIGNKTQTECVQDMNRLVGLSHEDYKTLTSQKITLSNEALSKIILSIKEPLREKWKLNQFPLDTEFHTILKKLESNFEIDTRTINSCIALYIEVTNDLIQNEVRTIESCKVDLKSTKDTIITINNQNESLSEFIAKLYKKLTIQPQYRGIYHNQIQTAIKTKFPNVTSKDVKENLITRFKTKLSSNLLSSVYKGPTEGDYIEPGPYMEPILRPINFQEIQETITNQCKNLNQIDQNHKEVIQEFVRFMNKGEGIWLEKDDIQAIYEKIDLEYNTLFEHQQDQLKEFEKLNTLSNCIYECDTIKCTAESISTILETQKSISPEIVNSYLEQIRQLLQRCKEHTMRIEKTEETEYTILHKEAITNAEKFCEKALKDIQEKKQSSKNIISKPIINAKPGAIVQYTVTGNNTLTIYNDSGANRTATKTNRTFSEAIQQTIQVGIAAALIGAIPGLLALNLTAAITAAASMGVSASTYTFSSYALEDVAGMPTYLASTLSMGLSVATGARARAFVDEKIHSFKTISPHEEEKIEVTTQKPKQESGEIKLRSGKTLAPADKKPKKHRNPTVVETAKKSESVGEGVLDFIKNQYIGGMVQDVSNTLQYIPFVSQLMGTNSPDTPKASSINPQAFAQMKQQLENEKVFVNR